MSYTHGNRPTRYLLASPRLSCAASLTQYALLRVLGAVPEHGP